MAIENRNLEPGTRLVTIYKKETFHALVVTGEDGKLKYRLEDGLEFKSPSSAGSSITGKACNGWILWSVYASQEEQSQVEQAEGQDFASQGEPEAEAAEAPEQEDAPEPAAGFHTVPNQRGVPAGEVRLYCGACQRSFTAPVGQQPDTCPQGHQPGDAAREEETQS